MTSQEVAPAHLRQNKPSRASEDMALLGNKLPDELQSASDDEQSTESDDDMSHDQPSSKLFIELIKVVVGKREAVFEVHRKYLLETPYFSRLLDGLLREGGSTQASLPDDSPAACERVLRYVYTGKVVSNIPGPECPDGYENGNEAIDETLLVMRMYLLADKLCLEDLANDLIDELRKSYKTWNISDYELKLALEYGNQTLKRLTLRKLVYQIKQDGWETVVTGNPDKIGKLLRSNAQHGMDVAKAISGYHDLDDLSRDADSCSWHVHEMRSKCDGPQGTKRKRP